MQRRTYPYEKNVEGSTFVFKNKKVSFLKILNYAKTVVDARNIQVNVGLRVITKFVFLRYIPPKHQKCDPKELDHVIEIC